MELGELSAPIQGKSEKVNSIRGHERKSIFRWFRNHKSLIYLTAALSLAAPFKHERLEAAEIPPGSTWSEGIQTLRNGVFSDKAETQGVFYIDNQTKQGKWILEKEGELTRFEYADKDVEKVIEREFSAHPVHDITVCILHNHPLSSEEAVGFITAEESRDVREGKHSAVFPPSGSAEEMDGDLALWHMGTVESAFKEFRKKNDAIEVRQGVVDPAGITYFQPIKDKDMKQIEHELPGIFPEVEHKRKILHEWEATIYPLVDNLNTASLNKLFVHTRDGLKYLIEGSYPEEEKRHDVKEALVTGRIIGGIENEEIKQLLFKDNPTGQEMLYTFKTQVLDKRHRYKETLAGVRDAFAKTSMTVAPEQLTSIQEYTKLREAFALNDTMIRFVSHEQVSNEPPCPGTDYKP